MWKSRISRPYKAMFAMGFAGKDGFKKQGAALHCIARGNK